MAPWVREEMGLGWTIPFLSISEPWSALWILPMSSSNLNHNQITGSIRKLGLQKISSVINCLMSFRCISVQASKIYLVNFSLWESESDKIL